ncbi:MAG: hypothetical protein ACUVQM_05400 [Candidatus Hadarchaeaceae archaeon]
MLGIAPCTGMVLFWILLAQGDVAKGVVITAINTLSTILLYTPLAAFYLGVGGVPVPITLIAEGVILFVGLNLHTAIDAFLYYGYTFLYNTLAFKI